MVKEGGSINPPVIAYCLGGQLGSVTPLGTEASSVNPFLPNSIDMLLPGVRSIMCVCVGGGGGGGGGRDFCVMVNSMCITIGVSLEQR